MKGFPCSGLAKPKKPADQLPSPRPYEAEADLTKPGKPGSDLKFRIEIDHPVDTEFVDEASEVVTPELVFHGHFHGASFGKSLEQAIRLFPAVRVQRNVVGVAGL